MAETDEDKIDGVLFGILIKKLRIERDMGSIELAILAFDDESKHTRISEYENGKVKSPRAKTLEPICLALDIEIEKLPVLL
ncbi:MAG: helix-turn-helix transcriptional regulator, partial [Pseudomonadota bacterium]